MDQSFWTLRNMQGSIFYFYFIPKIKFNHILLIYKQNHRGVTKLRGKIWSNQCNYLFIRLLVLGGGVDLLMYGTNNGIFDEVNLSNMGPDKEIRQFWQSIGDFNSKITQLQLVYWWFAT